MSAARDGQGFWRRMGAALPMRTALFAVAGVWVLGCVWSFREQSEFAGHLGFAFPDLLPLVIDGFAVSMAGVAWAASLDARPAVPARLATVVAVAASSASNGVWAWLRAEHNTVTVVVAVAVPVTANLAFEVLLAECRRQVQRRRGLPPPVPVPYPRAIRIVLSPWKTFTAWRHLVLELTAVSGAAVGPRVPTDLDELDRLDDGFEADPMRWWDTAPPMGYFELPDRTRQLIEAGVGRRRLSRELGVSEYEARQLLERTRPHSNGTKPAADAADNTAGEGESS